MSSNAPEDENEILHYEGGLPVFNARLEKVERKQEAEEARYKKEQLKIDRNMMYFTGALVVCSILSALVSGYQAHVARLNATAASENAAAAKAQADATKAEVEEMKKSGTDTHDLAEQAKSQTKLTGRLAENARETLSNTQAAFRDDQRAWIGIGDAIVSQFEIGKPIKVEIQVSNSGKTPALGVEFATVRNLGTSSILTVDTPSRLNATKLEVATSIPPQGHYILRSELPDTVAILKSKLQTLYVFGEVRYLDIFRRSHSTQFCVFMNDPDNPRIMAYCPSHNDMN